jgi:hypothetical protein
MIKHVNHNGFHENIAPSYDIVKSSDQAAESPSWANQNGSSASHGKISMMFADLTTNIAEVLLFQSI